jgi:hypothetical protein
MQGKGFEHLFLLIHRIGERVIRDNRAPVGILTFN